MRRGEQHDVTGLHGPDPGREGVAFREALADGGVGVHANDKPDAG